MDGTHYPVLGRCKNVAAAARGKGTGEPQVPSGMPIFVPREECDAIPRNSPSRAAAMFSPAFIAPPADRGAPVRNAAVAVAAAAPPAGHGAPVIGVLSVAAAGKEAWVPRHSPDTGDRRIFVPHTRQQQHDARPAGIDPVTPSGPAFEDPPAYLVGPDQRPTPATPATTAAGGSSNGATTDSEEEEDQPPGAAAKGEGEANAAAGRSPPAAARATGAAGSNGSAAPAALENLPSVAAKSIPNTPAMDARPSPAAARPKPCTSAVASDSDQRKETTFCERLLSCFGLCS